MINKLEDGIRNLDKVYNNFIEFDKENKIYYYNERQPEKKVNK
jgi:hypothetical protein